MRACDDRVRAANQNAVNDDSLSGDDDDPSLLHADALLLLSDRACDDACALHDARLPCDVS